MVKEVLAEASTSLEYSPGLGSLIWVLVWPWLFHMSICLVVAFLYGFGFGISNRARAHPAAPSPLGAISRIRAINGIGAIELLEKSELSKVSEASELEASRNHLSTHEIESNEGIADTDHSTEIWSGSEEGSYLRLIDCCITQL